MSYGAMGGDGQPQFQAQLFTRHRSSARRCTRRSMRRAGSFGRTWGATKIDLKLEEVSTTSIGAGARARPATRARMRERAYDGGLRPCRRAGAPSRKGAIEAAHDPRSDGGAAGL